MSNPRRSSETSRLGVPAFFPKALRTHVFMLLRPKTISCWVFGPFFALGFDSISSRPSEGGNFKATPAVASHRNSFSESHKRLY